MHPGATRALPERAPWAKSRLLLDAATAALPSEAERELGSAVAFLAALAAEVGAEPPLQAAREAVVPAWVQVQARRAPLPLRAARERVGPVRAERARPPRDQVTEGDGWLRDWRWLRFNWFRRPPAVGRPGPVGPLAPRRPLDTACKTCSSGAADQTTADKATPNRTCATPDAASAVRTEGPRFWRDAPRSVCPKQSDFPPVQRFTLHLFYRKKTARRQAKRPHPEIPEQTARRVSGANAFLFERAPSVTSALIAKSIELPRKRGRRG